MAQLAIDDQDGGEVDEAEVASTGDDQPLIVCAKAPAYLLDDRSLDVVLPALPLNGHTRADHIAHDQCAVDVNACVGRLLDPT